MGPDTPSPGAVPEEPRGTSGLPRAPGHPATDRRPQRVRVTGPPRQSAAPRRDRLGDVHEQTPLGGVYLRSLLREQLFLAVRILLLVAVTLGGLPLLFRLVPGLGDVHPWGLPLAWLLLGGAVYPFLLFLGWRYVRLVERNERDFADLLFDGSASDRPREEGP